MCAHDVRALNAIACKSLQGLCEIWECWKSILVSAQLFPITCKSASWTRKIWKCRNLPEGPLSEEKWRRVLCTIILLNFRSGYVPDRLGKSSCKVQQPRRLSGCNFDISAKCISQIVDNLLIVNLRRQSTTWKLECHLKMLNSGVRTSQDNYFQ